MRAFHRLLAAVSLLATAVAAQGQPIDASSDGVPDPPRLARGSLLALPSSVEADEWDRVTRLKAGTRVRVHLEPAGRKLGAVVRADDRELTILVDNVHEIISRDRIRRIERDHTLARATPWIGMLAGGLPSPLLRRTRAISRRSVGPCGLGSAPALARPAGQSFGAPRDSVRSTLRLRACSSYSLRLVNGIPRRTTDDHMGVTITTWVRERRTTSRRSNTYLRVRCS